MLCGVCGDVQLETGKTPKDLHFSAQERLALVSSEKIHVEPINRARNEQSENKRDTASPDVSDAYCTE